MIVQASTIRHRYPGDMAGYERDAPNATFCSDGYLARVGFMAPTDVRAFVDALELHGFRFRERDEFLDVAIVDQTIGPTGPCAWLDTGRHPLGFGVAWLKGGSPSPMAAPVGWSLKNIAQMHFTPRDEISANLLWLKRDGSTDVLLDYRTGRETRVGRTTAKPLIDPADM